MGCCHYRASSRFMVRAYSTLQRKTHHRLSGFYLRLPARFQTRGVSHHGEVKAQRSIGFSLCFAPIKRGF
jgi:hypothetical protein